MLSPADGALLALAFGTGSAATLVPKLLLRTPCAASCGLDGAGAPRPLEAPVFACTLVFTSAVLGLVAEALWARCRTTGAAGAAGADAAAPPRRPSVTRAARCLVAPALLSVGSLFLQLLALMFISAAVMAGLRGALILATAALSAAGGLKDRPAGRHEWRCVYAAAGGAVLVGAGAQLQAAFAPAAGNGDASSEGGGATLAGATAVAVGCAASLIGYALAAGQVTLEHVLLAPPAPAAARAPSTSAAKEGTAKGGGGGAPPHVPHRAALVAPHAAMPPLSKWQIMGVEGLIGLAVCGVALAGLAGVRARGDSTAVGGVPLDDPARTLCCLRHTPALPVLALAYAALSLAFNACLLALSASVGPSFRVFAFTARGLLTWGIEVGLWYTGAPRDYGEGVSTFSLLVGGGYALLIGSSLWRVRLQQAAAVAAAAAEAAALAPELAAKAPGVAAAVEDGDGSDPSVHVQAGDDLGTPLLLSRPGR